MLYIAQSLTQGGTQLQQLSLVLLLFCYYYVVAIVMMMKIAVDILGMLIGAHFLNFLFLNNE